MLLDDTADTLGHYCYVERVQFPTETVTEGVDTSTESFERWLRLEFERWAPSDESDRGILESLLFTPVREREAAAERVRVALETASADTGELTNAYAKVRAARAQRVDELSQRLFRYVRSHYVSLSEDFFVHCVNRALRTSFASADDECVAALLAHVISISPSALVAQIKKYVAVDMRREITYHDILHLVDRLCVTEPFYKAYSRRTVLRLAALSEEKLNDFLGDLCERECMIAGVFVLKTNIDPVTAVHAYMKEIRYDCKNANVVDSLLLRLYDFRLYKDTIQHGFELMHEFYSMRHGGQVNRQQRAGSNLSRSESNESVASLGVTDMPSSVFTAPGSRKRARVADSRGGEVVYDTNCLEPLAVALNRMLWLWDGGSCHVGHGNYVEERSFETRFRIFNQRFKRKGSEPSFKVDELMNFPAMRSRCDNVNGVNGGSSRFLGSNVAPTSMQYTYYYVGFVESGNTDSGRFIVSNVYVNTFEVRSPAMVQTLTMDYEKIGCSRTNRFCTELGLSGLNYYRAALVSLDAFMRTICTDDALAMLCTSEIIVEKIVDKERETRAEPGVDDFGRLIARDKPSAYCDTILDLRECVALFDMLDVERARRIVDASARSIALLALNVAARFGFSRFNDAVRDLSIFRLFRMCGVNGASSLDARDDDRSRLRDYRALENAHGSRVNRRRDLQERSRKGLIDDTVALRECAPGNLEDYLRERVARSLRVIDPSGSALLVAEPIATASMSASQGSSATAASAEWMTPLDAHRRVVSENDDAAASGPSRRRKRFNRFHFERVFDRMLGAEFRDFAVRTRDDHRQSLSALLDDETARNLFGLSILISRFVHQNVDDSSVAETLRDVVSPSLRLFADEFRVARDVGPVRAILCNKTDNLATALRAFVDARLFGRFDSSVVCRELFGHDARQSVCHALFASYVMSNCSVTITAYLMTIFFSVRFPGQHDRTAFIFKGSSSSGKSCMIEKIRDYFNSTLGVISDTALKTAQNEINTASLPLAVNFCVQIDELDRINAKRLKTVLSEGRQNFRRFHDQEPRVMIMQASLFITVNDMFSVDSDDGILTRLRFIMSVYHHYYDSANTREETRGNSHCAALNVAHQYASRTFPKGYSWLYFVHGLFHVFENYGRLVVRGLNDAYFSLADNRFVFESRDIDDLPFALLHSNLAAVSDRPDDFRYCDNFSSAAPVSINPQPRALCQSRRETLLKIDSFEKFLFMYTVARSERSLGEDDLVRWFEENVQAFWVSEKNPTKQQIYALVERFKVEFCYYRTDDDRYRLAINRRVERAPVE